MSRTPAGSRQLPGLRREQRQYRRRKPSLVPCWLRQSSHRGTQRTLKPCVPTWLLAQQAFRPEGLAQDIASMLAVLGELGDIPQPSALDEQSVEEFMDLLETALQARQAVRLNPLWDQASTRT
eukprot:5738865-Amphidinium_carterae.1